MHERGPLDQFERDWPAEFTGVGPDRRRFERRTRRHPSFKKAVAEAKAGILGSKVPLGGVARTPEQAREMVDRGYKAIVFGFDWLLLQQSASRFTELAKG